MRITSRKRYRRELTVHERLNHTLHEISPELARLRVPPRIGALYSHFLRCDACQRIYWEGSHWRGMCALLAPLLNR
ncbi:Mut7-C RNAse domain-containing protein [Pseudomonas jessenii]|uniref:Mut7-C RNAse domain-containing protein n=1 Tax=Pseudomonas jessenii TaxID=77298 RepID=UPI003D69B46D